MYVVVQMMRPRLSIPLALVASALLAAATAPLAGARAVGVGEDPRPNILVVMTDDMALSDIELMPNVKRLLVRQGTSFTETVTTFPLCCPSRATFLTGQYAHNHGVIGNFWPFGWYGMRGRKNTLPVWLDRAGYRTALIGKWLNGYGARDGRGEVPRGFDIWRGLLDVSAYDYGNFVMNRNGSLKTWGDARFARQLVEFAEIEVTPHEPGVAAILAQRDEVFGPPPYEYWGTARKRDYSPDVTGRVTARIVARQRRSRQPFFIWWSVAAPHREDVAVTILGRPGRDPRPPARYADQVSDYDLPRPPSFNEADISDKASNLTSTAPPLGEAAIERLERNYEGRIGSLLAVDGHVGRLVRTLRRTGQFQNTLIVFTSDNGWLQGQHRITGDKFLPYEESLLVPLVLRGPGVPKGRTITRQVGNVDLAPTLVDLANARAGRTMDGVSLLPGLRDPSRIPSRVLGIEAPEPLFEGDVPVNRWDRPYSGVRSARYTYVVWTETGEEELYDRALDPYQLTNLASDPAHAAIKAYLAAKLAELEDCRGASCTVSP